MRWAFALMAVLLIAGCGKGPKRQKINVLVSTDSATATLTIRNSNNGRFAGYSEASLIRHYENNLIRCLAERNVFTVDDSSNADYIIYVHALTLDDWIEDTPELDNARISSIGAQLHIRRLGTSGPLKAVGRSRGVSDSYECTWIYPDESDSLFYDAPYEECNTWRYNNEQALVHINRPLSKSVDNMLARDPEDW